MPKAKPVSLHPLTFHEALEAVVKAEPKHKARKTKKSRSPKNSSKS